MKALQTLGEASGWALIHFVWQGVLVFVALRLTLQCLREHSANARYIACCAALLLMFAAPVATIYQVVSTLGSANVSSELSREVAPTNEPAATANLIHRGDASFLTSLVDPITAERPLSAVLSIERYLDRLMPYLLLAWSAGALTCFVRFTAGWRETRRLKAQCAAPIAQYQEMVYSLAVRLRVSRPIRLCESVLVEVPTVIGWLYPLILVPTQALTGLDAEQLRALLAHELAHVRRHDYLLNVFQTGIEILLFYHPAVWWVSRQIRLEREHACDDLAVAACDGDAVLYARALLDVEEMRTDMRRPFIQMAADGGSLLMRINRILSSRPKRTSSVPLVAFSMFLFALLAAAILLPPRVRGVADPSLRQAQKRDATYQSMSADERRAFVEQQARALAKRISGVDYDFTPSFENEIQKSVDFYVKRIGSSRAGDPRPAIERGRNYAPKLMRTFKARNVSPLIGLYLPFVESEYVNLKSANSWGALGMFQFLPQTAKHYGLSAQELKDIDKSADAAARYISDSLVQFQSDPMKEALALLSYNRGRGKVEEDLQRVVNQQNRRCSICALTAAGDQLDENFQRESIYYVPRFFAAAIIGEHPREFGIDAEALSSYSAAANR